VAKSQASSAAARLGGRGLIRSPSLQLSFTAVNISKFVVRHFGDKAGSTTRCVGISGRKTNDDFAAAAVPALDRSPSPSGDAIECVEVLLVGFGQGVEVSLSGLDLCVAHSFHYALEVCAAGEQP
jgi:hypothetical protein